MILEDGKAAHEQWHEAAFLGWSDVYFKSLPF